MNPHFTLALLPLFLLSCSAPKKNDSYNTQGRLERSMKAVDMNKTSQFEKAFNTAGAGDRGVGSVFGRRSVEGKKFGGQKSFQTGSFKTKDFDTSGAGNRMGRGQSRMGSKDSPFANDEVATRTSRFASKGAREGARSFNRAAASVETRTFQPATKSLEENKHPILIKDPNAQREKVAYTEDEIKRMLGR